MQKCSEAAYDIHLYKPITQARTLTGEAGAEALLPLLFFDIYFLLHTNRWVVVHGLIYLETWNKIYCAPESGEVNMDGIILKLILLLLRRLVFFPYFDHGYTKHGYAKHN